VKHLSQSLICRARLEEQAHNKSAAEFLAFLSRTHGGAVKDGPKSPYRQVSVVRAAVDVKAETLASMPLMLSTGDDQLIVSGPIYDLLCNPAPGMGQRQFLKNCSAYLDLSGVTHLVFPPGTIQGGDDNPSGRPTQMLPVAGWDMKPVVSGPGRGELIGWKWRQPGRRWDEAIKLDLMQVVTIGLSSFDPMDPYGFSSPLESCGLPISQIYKSDVANDASLDNGIEPGGAWVTDKRPTPEQVNDTREELSKRHAGPKNRRRPLFLYGGMKWERIAATFDEMEFSTLQKMKQVDVCVALRVDPAAIGYYEDSNRAHGTIAKNSLWMDTTIPRGEWIADEIRRGVISRFDADRSLSGDRTARRARTMSRSQIAVARHNRNLQRAGWQGGNLVVWFDTSGVPAVRESMLSRAKEGAVFIEKYMQPPADVIDAFDLALPTYDWQKTGYMPVNLIPADEPMPGDDDPAGPPPQEPEDEDKALRDQRLDAQERELSEQQLARIYAAWRRSWSVLERQMRSKVQKVRHELRAETLANLDRVYGDRSEEARSGVTQRDLIAEIIFDISAANQRLIVQARPIVHESFRLGGEQAITEHGQGASDDADAPEFDFRDPEVERAMRVREVALTNSNRTLRRELAATIADAMSMQETPDQIAERIRQTFNTTGHRAKTIARTEVGRSVEEARQLGRKQAGTPLKSWLWSRAETGRMWHYDTERNTLEQPVANDGLFTIANTGNTCPHPRATGVRQDDINCSCTTIARFPGDGVKAVLDRYEAMGFLTYERLMERDDNKSKDADHEQQDK